MHQRLRCLFFGQMEGVYVRHVKNYGVPYLPGSSSHYYNYNESEFWGLFYEF